MVGGVTPSVEGSRETAPLVFLRLVMTIIKNIYDTVANQYDAKYQDDIHLVEDAINSIYLKSFEADTVLDIGCGTGHVIELAGLHPWQYFGVDISEEMVKVAQSKYPEYEIVTGDATNGFFGRFDLILAVYGQLNHMGLYAWVDILKANLGDSGNFYAVIYADTNNPDICYEEGNHKIFTAEQIDQAMSRSFPEYQLKGLSFPFEAGMPQEELFQFQIAKTESGSLEGCKYWILSS